MLSVYDLDFSLEDLVALKGEEAFLACFRRFGVVGLAFDGCVVGAVPVQLSLVIAWPLYVLKCLLFLAGREGGLFPCGREQLVSRLVWLAGLVSSG